ncbi:hypothetical protein HDE_14559 [Halotydeus destructor]|nr:hypothetical protein HDE_14559 [Halotydeus destructor]
MANVETNEITFTSVEWNATQRGNEIPTIDGHRFKFKEEKKSDGKKYWSCASKLTKCNVRVHTMGRRIIYINGEHNHAPAHEEASRKPWNYARKIVTQEKTADGVQDNVNIVGSDFGHDGQPNQSSSEQASQSGSSGDFLQPLDEFYTAEVVPMFKPEKVPASGSKSRKRKTVVRRIVTANSEPQSIEVYCLDGRVITHIFCNYCGEHSFRTIEALDEHKLQDCQHRYQYRRLHFFECGLCPATFRNRDDLIEHNKTCI